jgi:hypothetical protein
MQFRRDHIAALTLLAALIVPMNLIGCSSNVRVDNPHAVLADPGEYPSRQRAAMAVFDESSPDDPEYLQLLHGMIWRGGYTQPIRKEAVKRLEQRDLDNLKRTIRQRLPQITSMLWLSDLCEIIADRNWRDLTPALASSWARPTPLNPDETQRPEYQALVQMYGEDRIPDVIFDLFLESRSVAQQGLRTRCWDLMHRLGHRHRLVQLVTEVEPPADDAMLIDLHAGAAQLGIVPHNREEILWLRQLRRPERAEFWSQAVIAIQVMTKERRAHMELRDLPIAVAAYLHEPELLEKSDAQLYVRLEAYLKNQRHHDASGGRLGMTGQRERLHAHRHDLTWGDPAAMLLAVRAFQVPEMIDHLFDYAERDMRDETTEYGGIVNLDEHGRFELLEFPPVIRRHANKFIAPQAMFDAGYTGLFHFHNHAQRYRNADHASPGFGDIQYAENTRANCLVFTFINENTLNMDFYRHGGVVVDLGEIRRR